MSNFSPIAKTLLIVSILIFSQAYQMSGRHQYDFLNESYKSYCIEKIFSSDEVINEKSLALERTAELRKWIPNVFEHLMEAIIHICNNKSEKMTELINNMLNFSISYSIPFILCLIILLLLAGVWVYKIFWKNQEKSYSKAVGPQLTNKTQIFLSIFAVSLLLAISVSIYGISGTFNIQKSFNQIWCSLQKQDNGYLRNGNHSNGTLIDFALEINRFTTFFSQRYKAITSELSLLQEQKILTDTYYLNQKIQENFSNVSISNPHLSNLSLQAKKIVQSLTEIAIGEQSFLIYYNNTLQYEREVAIGFTYIKGNVDKYGNKFFKFSSISKLFSRIVQIILIVSIMASLISIVAIAYIIEKEKFDKISYYKYIIQYVLGIICLLGLIIAILNGFLVLGIHVVYSTSEWLQTGNNARGQFIASGSLNDPLVEIMVSFWPQSSGNMSQYGRSNVVKGISQFASQTNRLNELSLQGLQKQQEANLSAFLTLKKSINAIDKELQAIRTEMLSPQGLGRLDPSAFGHYAYDILRGLAIHIFNRCYEYRQIFGYQSIFLLMAVISSIFIKFSYKSYIRTHEMEDTENHLDMQHEQDQQRIRERKMSHEEIEQENYE